MGKGLLFFCCACCILVLTIVNLSIGPIISGTINTFIPEIGTLNCAKKKDDWDDAKDQPNADEDTIKYNQEYEYNACQRAKGMHDMEYTSFIFDIVLGFVCGLLGLLHLFDLKKDFVSNTGLIGLICGIVGFVLTFVYVVFNGLVYTTVYTNEPKIDGDHAFAEISGGKVNCLYFDDAKNLNSWRAKYSDLGKKQYNYDKDYSDDSNCACSFSSSSPTVCDNIRNECTKKETFDLLPLGSSFASCSKLYVAGEPDNFINKDISDRFLTTLILSLVVCLANIGLALFGFLLFRTPSDF